MIILVTNFEQKLTLLGHCVHKYAHNYMYYIEYPIGTLVSRYLGHTWIAWHCHSSVAGLVNILESCPAEPLGHQQFEFDQTSSTLPHPPLQVALLLPCKSVRAENGKKPLPQKFTHVAKKTNSYCLHVYLCLHVVIKWNTTWQPQQICYKPICNFTCFKTGQISSDHLCNQQWCATKHQVLTALCWSAQPQLTRSTPLATSRDRKTTAVRFLEYCKNYRTKWNGLQCWVRM